MDLPWFGMAINGACPRLQCLTPGSNPDLVIPSQYQQAGQSLLALRKDEGSSSSQQQQQLSPSSPYLYYPPLSSSSSGELASPGYGGYATNGPYSPRSRPKSKCNNGKRFWDSVHIGTAQRMICW